MSSLIRKAKGAVRTAHIVGSSVVVALLAGAPGVSVDAIAETIEDVCIQDRSPNNLTCKANDVRIARAFVPEGGVSDPCDDTPGDSTTFDLWAELTSTANKRYDIGAYVAKEGNARTGMCSITTFSSPPLEDFDGDACGDIRQNDTRLVHIGPTTVDCLDADGNGQLDLDTCLSWDNNAQGVCNGPQNAIPGTGSKCRCETLQVTGVPVPNLCKNNTCNDDDPCNGVETCDPANGKCVPGTPVDCSLLNDQCNNGVCNSEGTCEKEPLANGTDCTDGDVCTSDDGTPGHPDQCVDGTCTGIPVDCSDGDVCTNDACDPNDPDADENACVSTSNVAASARAFGLSASLGETTVISPTPDTDVENPDEVLGVGDPALVAASVLRVEASEAGSASARVAGVGALGGLLTATAVQASCDLTCDEETGIGISGETVLVEPALNGMSICVPAIPGDTCRPAVNTNIPEGFPGLPAGTIVRLNEQVSGASSLTVNAIHIFVIAEGNPFGLPVGAEVIVSSARCEGVLDTD